MPMGRPRRFDCSLNVYMTRERRKELRQIAYSLTIDEDRVITTADIIRAGIEMALDLTKPELLEKIE